MSGFNAHEYIAGKMFVGGLSSRTTQDSLRKYFEQFGQIFDCVLMMDKQTGRSRGFGFVTMIDPSVADEIMEKSPHVIDHRQVDIKRAIPKGQDSTENTMQRSQSSKPPQPLFQPYQQNRTQNEMTLAQLARRNEEAQRVFSNQKPLRRSDASIPGGSSPIQSPEVQNSAKIFVGGLTQDTNERDLRKYFQQFGETIDTVVMYERANKRSRGFGFVTFASSTVARYVLEWKKGHIINGRRVDCKKATPKEEGSNEPLRQSSYAPDSTINLYKADPSTTNSSEINEQAARAFVDNFLTRQAPRDYPAYPAPNYSISSIPTTPQPVTIQQRSLPSAVPLAELLGTSLFRTQTDQPGIQMAPSGLKPQSLQLGGQSMLEARQTQLDRERMQPLIVQPERSEKPDTAYKLPGAPGGPQYFQTNTDERRAGQMQLGGQSQTISDSMTTELIIQAYEKMLGKQDRSAYGGVYQKGVEERKEPQRVGGEVEYAEQDPRAGLEDRKRVPGQNVPLDPKLLLAALVSKSEFKPFNPPLQTQPVTKWGTAPIYPFPQSSSYISNKEGSKQPVNIYDFSNPNENLQQMVVPDDSWGPMKGQREVDKVETKNDNGEPLLNRAEDRVNKKPY